MSDRLPKDPLTAMEEAASSMHELFVSYLAAGFTEDQALRLVALLLRPNWPE